MQFGTDGIRGRAGSELTVDVAFGLGYAVARVFGATTVVGYDTRESSPLLANATLAGLAAGGVASVHVGVCPTPGVAVIANALNAAAVVISASHNPYYDNGLKVFAPGGLKLDQATESAVAQQMHDAPSAPATYDDVPVDDSSLAIYRARLTNGRGARDFAGLAIVLDCANGAASAFAPDLYRSLGAEVTVLHAEPNGRNINDRCGSTHPDNLRDVVLARGADVGLAFDGDADRLIAVDGRGNLRDGDDVMVLFALDFARRGVTNQLVVTSMSNLGLRAALGAAGIEIIETDVGDRNVLLALETHGLPFGGEQSGHLIFRDELATGDGMWSGLRLCALIAQQGPLADLADAAWHRAPQCLVNVPKDRYDDEAVRAMLRDAANSSGVSLEDVRVVIRPSGTEPVVRVMVESTSATMVDTVRTALQAHFSL